MDIWPDDIEFLKKCAAKVKKDFARLPANYKRGKKYKAYSNGEEETEHFQIAYDPEGEEYIITSETGFETSSKNLTQAIKDTMEDVEDFANEFCNDLDLEPESLSFGYTKITFDRQDQASFIYDPELIGCDNGEAVITGFFSITYSAEYGKDEEE